MRDIIWKMKYGFLILLVCICLGGCAASSEESSSDRQSLPQEQEESVMKPTMGAETEPEVESAMEEASAYSMDQIHTLLQESIMQHGQNRGEYDVCRIDLPEKFAYLPGVGLLYQGIPRAVSFTRFAAEELTDTELCNYLVRGVCLQASEPVEGLDADATYGLFGESYFVMADFGEVFGLDGTEEDFDELVSRVEEKIHVVLFSAPESHVHYMLKVNADLISKEECLELAAGVTFSEDAFSKDLGDVPMDGEKESDEISTIKEKLAEREEWVLAEGRAFLKVTLPGQEENLVPEGFFAVKEAEGVYSLCIHNGYPVGRLTVGETQAEVEMFHGQPQQDEWLYYELTNAAGDYDAEGNRKHAGLWRIHTSTGAEELIWEGGVRSYLVTEDSVYLETNFGIQQCRLDGEDMVEIKEGTMVTHQIALQDNWLYFYQNHCRDQKDTNVLYGYNIETQELRELLVPTNDYVFPIPVDIVVSDSFLYMIMTSREDGTSVLLSYNLTDGNCEYYSMDEMNSGSYALYECGDYLVAECWAEKEIVGMYATRKGKVISEETEWEQVSLDGMIERHIVEDAFNYNGLVFHEGTLYFLNDQFELCSRPLLGDVDDVVVYDGTQVAVAQEMDYAGHLLPNKSCTLSFGEDMFLYRYCTRFEINREYVDEQMQRIKFQPTEWTTYMGQINY